MAHRRRFVKMISNITMPAVGGFITSFIRRNKLDVASPPILSGVARRPYGAFQFQFSLAKNSTYQIHASTDMKHWVTIGEGVAEQDNLDYVDSDAFKFSYRFYRVFSGAFASTSIVGYAAVLIPPGFSLIANPLNAVSNSIGSVLPNVPENTTLHKYDSTQCKLIANLFTKGQWSRPHDTLAPGEGAILCNPTDEFRTLNFVGEALHGNLFNPIPAGFSIRSSIVPQPGRLDTDLDFPINEGDCVHVFDRDKQQYVVYEYPSRQWQQNPPVIGVGEAFWIGKNSPGNWVREFIVQDN
jgi:hypothetical protein